MVARNLQHPFLPLPGGEEGRGEGSEFVWRWLGETAETPRPPPRFQCMASVSSRGSCCCPDKAWPQAASSGSDEKYSPSIWARKASQAARSS